MDSKKILKLGGKVGLALAAVLLVVGILWVATGDGCGINTTLASDKKLCDATLGEVGSMLLVIAVVHGVISSG